MPLDHSPLVMGQQAFSAEYNEKTGQVLVTVYANTFHNHDRWELATIASNEYTLLDKEGNALPTAREMVGREEHLCFILLTLPKDCETKPAALRVNGYTTLSEFYNKETYVEHNIPIPKFPTDAAKIHEVVEIADEE